METGADRSGANHVEVVGTGLYHRHLDARALDCKPMSWAYCFLKDDGALITNLNTCRKEMGVLARHLLAFGLCLMTVACAGRAEPTSAPTEVAAPTEAPVETNTPMNSPVPTDFDVQGHRGARGLKPENTLPAFETALDLGVTTLELDLHFTADGEVVVWHDPVIDPAKCYLDPAAGVAAPDPDDPATAEGALRISQLTLAQIQAYHCDRNPEPDRFPDQENSATPLAGDDYRIVTLGELFDFVEMYAASEVKSAAQREQAGRVQFNVETKRRADAPENIGDNFDGVNPGPFEEAILAEVEGRNLVSRTMLQSFDHRSLWAAARRNEEIRLVALTSGETPEPASLVEQGADVWSPRARDLTSQRLSEAQAAGLKVIPWTVNVPTQMETFIILGVDGLITDRPDLLISLFEDQVEE